MSEQQESVKKKTLKSSSRSFLFSTGLMALNFALVCSCFQKQFEVQTGAVTYTGFNTVKLKTEGSFEIRAYDLGAYFFKHVICNISGFKWS